MPSYLPQAKTVVKIVPPTVVIMQIEWREIKPASDSPKRKPRKKVKGREQLSGQANPAAVRAESCLYNNVQHCVCVTMERNSFVTRS